MGGTVRIVVASLFSTVTFSVSVCVYLCPVGELCSLLSR